MPTMPCDCRVNCPGTDSPFANLTAEAPDRIVFIGNSWGWDDNVPPLGTSYSKTTCYATCESTVSQQEADLCAAQLQLECLVHPGPLPCNGTCASDGGGGWVDGSPDSPSPVPLFRNVAAFCTVSCPDGNPFTYTVRAGLFTALDQETADRMAIALACQNARLHAICLQAINGSACINQPYVATFRVIGGSPPYVFSIQSGSLPPTVGFFQDSTTVAVLSGQPSASGNYTFTLRVSDADGNFMNKTYTIYVLGANNLPQPQVGTPYSQQISVNGGLPPYTFSSATGLPAGLTMDANGLVSGTATSTSSGFTFTVTDAIGNACTLPVTFGAACSVVTFTTTSPLQSATQNSAYSTQLVISGGSGPFTYSLLSGSLPTGLGLSASGLISGTPTGTGTSGFTVRVVDGSLNYCDKAFSLTVNAAGSCAGQPVNIQDATFTRTIPETACNTGQIVNGTCAAWMMQAGGGCPNASGPFINWNGTICNPNAAPYNITITVNWAVAGTPAPGPNVFQLSATVDAGLPTAANGNILTGLPTPLQITFPLPSGTHTIAIQIVGTDIGSPQITYSGDLHITPLTHP